MEKNNTLTNNMTTNDKSLWLLTLLNSTGTIKTTIYLRRLIESETPLKVNLISNHQADN